MKKLAEHMAFYGCYHRDPRNRMTHFFGVPAIIFAVLIPLSLGRVQVGMIGASPAVIWTGIMVIYYVALDMAIGVAMAVLFVPLLWGADLVASAGTTPAFTIFAAVFTGGWIVQLIGHRFEGNKPALTANLFQTLVSPIFLTAELFFAFGYKRALQKEVERRILTRDFPGAETTLRNAKRA